MGNKLIEVFNPGLEETVDYLQRIVNASNEIAKKKDCNTCLHSYFFMGPHGYIDYEECKAGLKSDRVGHSVKNCPKWEKSMVLENQLEEMKRRIK